MIFKAAQEFLAREGRRSKFSHDDSRAVVGNFRRLLQGCSRTERECEQRNRGISGPRNIEHLFRARRGMVGGLIAIEKQHAMLAQCDQQRSESEFLQKSSSSLQQGFVRKRVISGAGISHASHAERFGSVGLDRRRTPPPQRISRIGIGSKNSARLGDHCADAIDKALCKKSLPVVLEDDSVHARQNFSQLLEG